MICDHNNNKGCETSNFNWMKQYKSRELMLKAQVMLVSRSYDVADAR